MVTAIDRAELVGLIEADDVVQIVAVLPAYTETHIPGALTLPLKRLNADTVKVLDRAKPVVVY